MSSHDLPQPLQQIVLESELTEQELRELKKEDIQRLKENLPSVITYLES